MLQETATEEQDLPQVKDLLPDVINDIQIVPSSKAFIEANTIEGSLESIKQEHIIPVFIKDNEPIISHAEFIETVYKATLEAFPGEAVLSPNIRLSHPVKGRIPEARNKPAIELLEHEKTLYYERMAFILEMPTISTEIEGSRLNLTIGGVKAYNLDNLYNKSGADQHFKVFIGFKNLVCTNLCVSTDGYMAQLKVKSLEQLQRALEMFLKEFNAVQFAKQLQDLQNYELTEQQFASFIGRCKMYRFMPDAMRQEIADLSFGDAQINTVCRDYYADASFCSNPDGSINLWRLYNLFTGAAKSSYIDSFLDRDVNAFDLVASLQKGLKDDSCWFLR